MTDVASAVDQLLAAIELRELKPLQWGFVDGSLREAEVDQIALQVIERLELGISPEDLVEDLVTRRLLIELGGGAGAASRYRSRFAETVRLLVRLRQLFPGRPWASAPRLVSDYRVDASPRRFPARLVDEQDAVGQLGGTPGWNPRREALCRSLLNQDGRGLRLSGFQVRAAKRLLGRGSNSVAAIVTAGTGSGKTLAFYLPAIVELGELVGPSHWTKCLAIYPRIELLKDQVSEVYGLLRYVDGVLAAQGQRPLTIGTLFSLTPSDATTAAVEQANWARKGGHFVCPFARCPKCGGELLWRRADLEVGDEQLVCADDPGCTGRIPSGQILLTRSRVLAQPPDFVFTTIETLSQRMSDPSYRSALGIGRIASERPRFLLLDEVHTYVGTQGAHAAFALRRFRKLAGDLAIVGLSATLRDAPRFFADLTGYDESAVAELTAASEEYQERGMAYQLVLRGDPASRASLLSTSIQASMLLARMLDVRPADGMATVSQGAFGQRAFVFTDDLDVTNRLFDDLRNAEAYDHFGTPDPKRQPLAVLRSRDLPDAISRGREGQRWDAAEAIGHNLSRRLKVTRTSSQDAGVSSSSDLVVATSSLEVGFNDPTVGAIVQHKAPLSMAAFLQRKGRAGRRSTMRPWMVTVLSDYGRDRLAFQSYERLLDPLLTAQRLPTQNGYVLRMQATFAFIDWLAFSDSPSGRSKWWWWAVNGPTKYDATKKQQQRLGHVLDQLLDGDPEALASLKSYLQAALAVDDATLDRLLWAPPRSLLLEVVPTLSRRLRTNWRLDGGTADELDIAQLTGPPHPLPDFLPASLFGALDLPEVSIILPAGTRGEAARSESLPILKALRLVPPGRVLRRFAFERGGLSHWMPVPLDANDFDLSVDSFAERNEFVADVPAEDGVLIPCYRPWTIRLQRTPVNVDPKSQGEFCWASRLIASEDPISFELSRSTPWRRIVERVDFFLHSRRATVTVQRYTERAVAHIRRVRRDDESTVNVRLVDSSGHRAAVGFEQDVDGLRLRLSLPTPTDMLSKAEATTGEHLATWRSAYFRHLVVGDPTLAPLANKFQLDWLYQIYLASLLLEADSGGVGLRDAAQRLRALGVAERCREVMAQLFQFDMGADDSFSEDEQDESDVPGSPPEQRLVQALSPLFENDAVVDRLEQLSQVLWSELDAQGFGSWLRERLADTVGEALLVACQQLVPAHSSPDALFLDVVVERLSETNPMAKYELWVTETVLGGAGVLEAIAKAYAADPANFARALDAAVAASDLEVLAGDLDAALELMVSDADVAAAADLVRNREDQAEREASREALYVALGNRGVGIDHSFSVALQQRLLRRGASRETDVLLHDLRSYWTSLGSRLGVSIDLRTFAYLAAVGSRYGPQLRETVKAIAGHEPSVPEVVGVLSGILWPQPGEVRGRSLESYSPFRAAGRADPAIARLVLDGSETKVSLDGGQWERTLLESLGQSAVAWLKAPRSRATDLQIALLGLLATPIDFGYLQFFPSVDRLLRDENEVSVRLVLRELY
jgi:DEAD/DEAH box helicase